MDKEYWLLAHLRFILRDLLFYLLIVFMILFDLLLELLVSQVVLRQFIGIPNLGSRIFLR
ncbi:MAG: hypothetical protein RLZZ74_1204 [Cyanobacteriota bacterium]|jgi:hypothetical protein